MWTGPTSRAPSPWPPRRPKPERRRERAARRRRKRKSAPPSKVAPTLVAGPQARAGLPSSIELELDPLLAIRCHRRTRLHGRLVLPARHRIHRRAVEDMPRLRIQHLHVAHVAGGRDGEADLYPAFLRRTHGRGRVAWLTALDQHRTVRAGAATALT